MKTITTRFLVGGMLATVGFGLVGACVDENPLGSLPYGPQFAITCGSGEKGPEEEIFGTIEAADSTASWTAYLQTRDSATLANQDSYWFDITDTIGIRNQAVNHKHPCVSGGHANNWTAHYGWYGRGFTADGTPCLEEAPGEAHRAVGDSFPQDSLEQHCAGAGRFTFSLVKETTDTALIRPLDFIGYTAFDDCPTVGLNSCLVEDSSRIVNGDASADIRVGYDSTTGSGVSTASVELTAAYGRTDSGWVAVKKTGSFHEVPRNFVLRFGAWNSTSSPGNRPSLVLVRYFWNWTSDRSDRSGFANPINQGKLVRILDISPDPAIDSTRTVVAHVVQSNEHPTSPAHVDSVYYGDTVHIPIKFKDTLTVNLSANDSTVAADTGILFTASGGNGTGDSLSYDWAFGDTSYTTLTDTTTHDYASTGIHHVRVKKRNTTAFYVVDTMTVWVWDPMTLEIRGEYEEDPYDHEIESRQQSCYWEVDVEGGDAPLQYEWYRRNDGGSWSGTLSTTWYLIGASGTVDFDLKVVVTDDAEQVDSTTVSVSVTSRGQVCLQK